MGISPSTFIYNLQKRKTHFPGGAHTLNGEVDNRELNGIDLTFGNMPVKNPEISGG
jgi:hypothetical protein